jgi:hypothetical protein
VAYNVWIVTGLLARLRLPDGPRRTAALVSWFQSLYRTGPAPVLVGRAAAQLHARAGGAGGDLDFVGDVTADAASSLRRIGFREQDRRWTLPSDGIVLDLPAARLTECEAPFSLDVDDMHVLTLSPEDAIVDRLAAWQRKGTPSDALAAYRILHAPRRALEAGRLEERARRRGVLRALDRLRALASRLRDREK